MGPPPLAGSDYDRLVHHWPALPDRCVRRLAVTRTGENLVLVLTAVSTGFIAVNGAYTRYVKPAMYSWLVVSAGVLLAIVLIAITDRASRRDHDDVECGGHPHGTAVVWLLVVPIALLMFVSPPPLGALAATPSAAAPSASDSLQDLHRAYPALPAERAPTLTITEVDERLRYDTAHTLDGRLISVIGFIVSDADTHYLARFHIICCAADARIVRLRLTGPLADEAAGFARDTWLRVEGTAAPGAKGPAPRTGPALAVTGITPIDPLADPYLYY